MSSRSPANDEQVCDTRPNAAGRLVDEVAVKAWPPTADGWLPPGAALPPKPREEAGILDLREHAGHILLSFRRHDNSLLWQEALTCREDAEALALRAFGVSPDRWRLAPAMPVGEESREIPEPDDPLPCSLTVAVARLTESGNWAFWVGAVFFGVLMMAGMFGSMAFARYLELSGGMEATVVTLGSLLSMLLALVGLLIPTWVQIRFFGKNEFSATTRMTIGPEGIVIDALGRLPWAAVNAIDQVNTETGEAEAVLLMSDAWGKLMFRAPGAGSNVKLAGKLLEALLTYWLPDKYATGQTAGAPEEVAVFHLLPIRRWWHDALHYFGILTGMAMFFAIMSNGNREPFANFLGAIILGGLTWAIVALMPQHFWTLTAANRARAFLLQGHWLADNSKRLRIDLSQARVTWVFVNRPAQELEYLHIHAPGLCPLRLSAFDNRWNDFVVAVRAHAGDWREVGRNDRSPERTLNL